MATITARPLTAAEYLQLPDTGTPTELVRGEVVAMTPPGIRLGEICLQTGFLLRLYLREHPTGRAVSNDSGVLTEHDPDTVRGPDLSYYSYQRLPRGTPSPRGYSHVPPELVFEVRSPSDRWADVINKVNEYIRAGVSAIAVLDDETETVTVFSPDERPRVLAGDGEVTFPTVLEHFRIPARRFFESE